MKKILQIGNWRLEIGVKTLLPSAIYYLLSASVICYLLSAICLHAGTLVVADFNNGDDPLNIGSGSGVTSTEVANATGTYVSHSEAEPAHGNTGYSLKIEHLNTNDVWMRIDFNINYVNVVSTFNTDGTYKALSFWVKGKDGGETFEINLRALGGIESDWRPHITHFLPAGITTSWQKVVVPVETLVQGFSQTNVQQIDGIIFNFRNLCPAETIYIDDVRFHTAVAPVYVDSFEDGASPNAWNGAHGDYVEGGNSSGTVTTTYVSTETYSSSSYALQVIWSTGTAGVSDNATFITPLIGRDWGAGTSGVDMSVCDTISCEVKADADGNGKILGLGLTADPGSEEEKIAFSTITLSTSWQTFTRTFSSDFPSITNTNVCDFALWICNQYAPRDALFKNTTGFTFYVDNIVFKDTNLPTTPSSFKDDGNTIANGHGFGLTNVLTVTADAIGTDASLESVRFEHDGMTSGATWYVIGTDTDTADASYTTTWDTSGLVPGSTYHVRVVAMDIAGNEGALTYISCSLGDGTPPSAIDDLSATTGLNSGEIDMVWTAPGDDGGSGTLTGTYRIQHSTYDVTWSTSSYNISLSTSNISPGDSQNYTITGLTGGARYNIRIWTSDEVGNWSDVSNSANMTAQTGISVSPDGGTVYYKDGATNVFMPAGATDADITVSISVPDINDTSAVPDASLPATRARPLSVYEFGPAGTVFKKPVSVTLLYPQTAGIDETTLKIFWWDGFTWRYIGGTVNTISNTVSADVMHFSKFAVFPAAALSASDYRPKRKIITPFRVDGWNDYIQFDGVSGDFEIKIYDITGKKVRTLKNPIWNGYDDDGNIVESGVYIYQLKTATGELISGTVTVAK